MVARAYTEANAGTDYCDSWLKAYIQHQRYSESPLPFHFWTGVATIAGALRRKVWIDQRHFLWTPNFYIVLVAPAGVAAKSTSIGGLSLLEHVEGVHFGPQSMTWQALIKSFVNAQTTFTPSNSDKPVPMSCLTIGVGELGTFLDPKNREAMDFLTDMWDSRKGVWRRETVGSGKAEIYNPWLNLIAGTTPSWLRSNFPEDLIGGGLTSRIVFVFGDRKRQLIAYPSTHIEDEDYKQEEACLIHDLQQIGEICGEYKIDQEAIDWGESWYRHHNNGGLPAHLASGRFDGYLARKQAHIHKLAIILAASRRSDLRITTADLIEAEGHISALERDMLQVFNSIGNSPAARITSEVVTLIRNHKTITYKDLFRLVVNTHSEQDYFNAIKAALTAGYITKAKIEGQENWTLTYVGKEKH